MLILTCIVVAVLMHVAAPSNRECNQYDGICQNKYIACNGVYVDGWCCGGANIQCCLTGLRYKGRLYCIEDDCHTRCRNGNTNNRKMFLTGYCRGKICQCSNECTRVANSAVKCLVLCIEKGFAGGTCLPNDDVCHCEN